MRDDSRTLMPLLFGLTFLSGLIDAVSFLQLGRVFVANMTGNVVLLGFAIAGAKGISIAGSLIALAAFMFGALIGGRLSRSFGESGARVLALAAGIKILFLIAAATAAWIFGTADAAAYTVITLLGIPMGLQTAAVRSLGIPDITTTVLTSTITGIAADSSLAGGENTRIRRRITSVALMFAGALLGAFVVFRFGVVAAIAAATLVLAIVSAVAWRLTQRATMLRQSG